MAQNRPGRIFQQLRPKGIVSDISPAEVPPESYTAAINVQFRQGFAERANGTAAIFDPPLFAPLHLINVIVPPNVFWMYGGDTQIAVVDESGVHSDITPAAPPIGMDTKQNGYTGGRLNGLGYLNFQQDPPAFWDGVPSNIMQPFPDWQVGETAQTIRPFKFGLIAMNLSNAGGDFPVGLKWSAFAPPGQFPQEWTPTPQNSAGDLQLTDAVNQIIDGHELRGQFLIFTDGSIYILSFVGGTFVYAVRRLSDSVGALNRNCIVEFAGKLAVFGDGDIYVTDGQQIESIVDNKMRNFVFRSINAAEFQRSYTVHYKAVNEIWFCYPESGNIYPNIALVWDYANDALGVRSLGGAGGIAHIKDGLIDDIGEDLIWDSQTETWDSRTDIWNESRFNLSDDSLMQADFTDTELQHVNEGNLRLDNPIFSVLNRDMMDFDSPNREKLVKAVYPRLNAIDGMQLLMRVGGAPSPSSPIDWSPMQVFTAGQDIKSDFLVSGRYLSFQFSSVGEPTWGLDGWDVEYAERGFF